MCVRHTVWSASEWKGTYAQILVIVSGGLLLLRGDSLMDVDHCVEYEGKRISATSQRTVSEWKLLSDDLLSLPRDAIAMDRCACELMAMSAVFEKLDR